MKDIFYFLFILVLETLFGLILAFLYWMLSSSFFDKDDFGQSRINEIIYYMVILIPPCMYCMFEYLRFKRKGLKNQSTIYLSAGLVYFIGGLVFILILTDFYLLTI